MGSAQLLIAIMLDSRSQVERSTTSTDRSAQLPAYSKLNHWTPKVVVEKTPKGYGNVDLNLRRGQEIVQVGAGVADIETCSDGDGRSGRKSASHIR